MRPLAPHRPTTAAPAVGRIRRKASHPAQKNAIKPIAHPLMRRQRRFFGRIADNRCKIAPNASHCIAASLTVALCDHRFNQFPGVRLANTFQPRVGPMPKWRETHFTRRATAYVTAGYISRAPSAAPTYFSAHIPAPATVAYDITMADALGAMRSLRLISIVPIASNKLSLKTLRTAGDAGFQDSR